ncbi:MAG: hypothetical protein JWM80_1062 [Cyanobacteria bacterium RYN_339]|nr:hypothetical protein [Cyanobacteria bacterium RYN_339]
MRELQPEMIGAAVGGWAGLAIGLLLAALGYGGFFQLPSPSEAYAAGVLAGAAGGLGLGVIISAIGDEAGRAALEAEESIA